MSAGILLTVPLALSSSAAAWLDQERVNGTVATADCSDSTGFISAAEGAVLSGSVLGASLDPIASLAGASATHTGVGGPVDDANPFAVGALGAVNATMPSLFQFDLGAEAGALRQFAHADGGGFSAASAGAVADSGSIDLAQPTAGEPVPRFATLELGQLLEALVGVGLGGGIAGLSDARLTIGALASFATLDGCNADWTGSAYPHLERHYLVAGLGAELDSPLVGSLATTVAGDLDAIAALVDTVAGSSGLTSAIGDGVVGLLAPTLSGFGVGTPVTTVTLEPDFAAVSALLNDTISDSAGTLTVDLASGTVRVDLAGLLGPSYQDSVGINGLAPNAELLINQAATSAVLGALDSALSSWLGTVSAAVDAALSVIRVNVLVQVPISVGVPALGLTVPVGYVNVSVTDASLSSLIAGTAPVAATLALTPPSCSGISGAIICGVVNPLLTGLTAAVAGLVLGPTAGPLIGGLVQTALAPVVETSGLIAHVSAAAGALLTFISSALSGLFGPSAVLSLVANAQNSPDPADISSPPGTEPMWSGLGASAVDPYRTGEYRVAALRLVTLGFLATGLSVDLASSTVGSNGPQ